MSLDVQGMARRLRETVGTVIVGKEDEIDLCIIGLLCRGHLLIEDVPGTGKTLLAKTLARATGCSFERVQFTPDLLPGDVTGVSVYNPQAQSFEFRRGPVFTQVLLADEINRATPKTQSALLEAMEEGQVTVDGTTYPLPEPFIVLATQNPIEQAGTFPLPEAQLDRFLFKLQMGYMDRDHELEVTFDNSIQLSIEDLGPVIQPETITRMIEFASTIDVSSEVGLYIVDLVHATRRDPAVAIGGSPRASIALLRASRVLAASDGREHVYPDDVRTVLRPVLAHRMILNPDAILRGESVDAVIERVTNAVKPPMVAGRRSASGGE